jgi:endogenous inhibitor of DNA gyrase (YacG/DUF329 family)
MISGAQEGAVMREQRTVACAQCGKVADARRPHKKFCSPKCRIAAWWRKKNEQVRK